MTDFERFLLFIWCTGPLALIGLYMGIKMFLVVGDLGKWFAIGLETLNKMRRTK